MRAKRKQRRAVACTEKIKHPTGMCKWDITHKAGGKPLQRAPRAALCAHTMGETARVRAKGKAARGPENITRRQRLSKLEPAGTERVAEQGNKSSSLQTYTKSDFSWRKGLKRTPSSLGYRAGSFSNCKESEGLEQIN